MAYYNYYRQHNPNMWGTRGYEPESPPAPRYQPQPQWRGGDYYRAHNDGIQDSSAFDYVWGRMKSHLTGGLSRRESQSWHKRVYGGQTDVATMMPIEIGAAAGYEAWRFFDYHRGIYRQPLMDDREREGEALVGLAVGEAEKLWGYTKRHGDKYGKREALETAAAVAMKLYRKGNEGRYDPGVLPTAGRYEQDPYHVSDSRYPRSHHGRHRDRRSSSVSPSSYDGRDELRRGYASGGDYSDGDLEYNDYGRSPAMSAAGYHQGSPSILTSALPMGAGGMPTGGSYGRRRASSSAYQTRPNFGPSTYASNPYEGSAISSSPGHALVLPSPSHHHASSFGGYNSGHGLPVQSHTYGDPRSEYGHLPPGTYMVTGGSGSSGRRKHRKSHSNVRYVL